MDNLEELRNRSLSGITALSSTVGRATELYDVAGYIDALEKALEGRGWMPIEMAPKDGQMLILCDGKGDVPASHPGSFNQNIKSWEIVTIDDVFAYAPTHWMPIPAPPSQTEVGG